MPEDRWKMPKDNKLSEVRFLTVAEVAEIMRVSKMTVYRLVHSGELPAVRVGRSFRVPEDAVNEYLHRSFFQTDLPLDHDIGEGPGTEFRAPLLVGAVRRKTVAVDQAH